MSIGQTYYMVHARYKKREFAQLVKMPQVGLEKNFEMTIAAQIGTKIIEAFFGPFATSPDSVEIVETDRG